MFRTNKLSAFILLIAVLLLVQTAGIASAAPAQTANSSKIDAVLVVDVSNSMNKSDKNKISNEAMKMFIDMLSAKGDKVGIVAYTDQIQREKALMDIQSTSDKDDLKQFIDQLDRGPYTDISVGVKEAVKVLQHGSDPGHEPMIVLLADGNNDLDENSGRTEDQANQDLQQAVADAKKEGIPVYTIGLNADGKLNKDSLAELAKTTGGKSFVTSTADDLPEILSEIFASHLKLKIVPVKSMTADGSYQEVTVTVPNANVLEANISIMSGKPVTAKLTDPSGKDVPIPSSDVLLAKSKSYSLIKLLSPQQGDWKLQIKGVPQDKIDINLVFNYDLALTMDPLPAGPFKKGDKLEIRSFLESNGSKVQNSALYSNMKSVLIVKDMDTGVSKEIDLTNKGDSFEGAYQIADSHEYELKVRAEEKSFYRETAPVKISAKAAGSAPAKTPAAGDSKDDKGFPVLPVVIGIVLLLILLAAGWFILTGIRKANKGFVGQMVIEVRDENTGEKSYPQYKKLTAFKGKFHLHQLLQLAPELKETENIVFVPGPNDRIIVKNGAAGTIEKSGRAVDASRGLELKSGDRITIPLHNVDKTIFIEYLV